MAAPGGVVREERILGELVLSSRLKSPLDASLSALYVIAEMKLGRRGIGSGRPLAK